MATVTRPIWSVDRPLRSVQVYRGRVTSTSRSRVDEDIVDRAAGLFARHGFEHTSVQAVADAVGLSKAGLLHHFPSKEALRTAVRERADGLGAEAVGRIGHLTPGPERDHRAIETLVDVAAAHPGLVSYLLAPISDGEDSLEGPDCSGPADQPGVISHAMAAFGLSSDPDPTEDDSVFERRVRVAGALVVLGVLSLSLAASERPGALRAHVIATSYDALGHRRPSAPSAPSTSHRPPAARPDQVEA